MKTIVSFSGGKDSTAMLLRLLELGEQIDEIVFADTGFEFPEFVRKSFIRSRTRLKYPLKNKKCEFCDKLAIAHHHYTEPYEIDKFYYVCRQHHRIKENKKNGIISRPKNINK